MRSAPLAALLLWAPVLLPALAGAYLGLVRSSSRSVAAVVTLGAAGLTFAVALVAALTLPGVGGSVDVPFLAGSTFGLQMDPLAAVVSVTVTGVALLVLIFAVVDVRVDLARFGGLMLLFLSAVLVTVTATTLPTVIFAWELMGATSYALIGFSWLRVGNVAAGAVAFLATRSADLGLYVAAGAALAGGKGLRLADLPAAPPGWRTLLAAGIAVSALGKAAQLPFAFWLSKAMAGPSPVSALLHSAAMVAMGGFLVLRVSGLLTVSPGVAAPVAWVGALTTVALGLVAVAQPDLKQVLAASTSAQLGFVVLGAGVGGVVAGTTQLVAHAGTKALLFLVAGAWLSALGSKQLTALRGAARRYRVMGILATIGLLSLAGIAPLALWASKEAVLAAALPTSAALYVVGLVGALLSAAYAGRVLRVVWKPIRHNEVGLDVEEKGTRRVPPAMVAPLAVLAMGAATLGLLVVPAAAEALRSGLGGPGDETPGALEMVLSALMALVVTGAVWRWPVPEISWAGAWFGLETAARRLLVAPTDRLAVALARFDDRVLDRGVDAVGHGSVALAVKLAQADDDGVDGAVEGLVRSLRRAGSLARLPQTGQLHQYYLQSAAVLVVVALVLIAVGR